MLSQGFVVGSCYFILEAPCSDGGCATLVLAQLRGAVFSLAGVTGLRAFLGWLVVLKSSIISVYIVDY